MGVTTMYQTIEVREQRGVLYIKFNRPEANNSLNSTLIEEICGELDRVESDPGIKVVVLEGNEQNFCTGMDFNAIANGGNENLLGSNPDAYYNLLKCISTCSKVVISKVDGKVNAGGIGIVSASDIVIAGEQSTFGLSEALFGLLPAMVMPFLIRRVGVQKAQFLTLVTQGISNQRAYEIGLVDELTGNTQDALRRNLLRLTRLESSTIKNLKRYMESLWIIDEQTQRIAVNKLTELIQSETVENNIKNFVNNGKFPWDK